MELPGLTFKALPGLACTPVCSRCLSLLPASPLTVPHIRCDLQPLCLRCSGCSEWNGPLPSPCPLSHLSSTQLDTTSSHPRHELPLLFSSYDLVHASELSPWVSHIAWLLWCLFLHWVFLNAWHIARVPLNVWLNSWCQRFQKRSLYPFFIGYPTWSQWLPV